MINWLLQTADAHPDLARGVPPPGLLGQPELERFEALKIEKRRRDWLLGRWTAKHLIQSYVEQRAGLRLPLDTLLVESGPDGAPRVEIGGWKLELGDSSQSSISSLQSLILSISHSGDRAFCAIGQAGQIGADIERSEPRDSQFVEDYFTADEIAQLRRAPAEQRDQLTTAIWSAKEAALKAFRLGLSVDTRGVACSLAIPDQADEWASITFAYDQHLLPPAPWPALTGWWRTIDSYVLTVAAPAEMSANPPQLARLSPGHRVREV